MSILGQKDEDILDLEETAQLANCVLAPSYQGPLPAVKLSYQYFLFCLAACSRLSTDQPKPIYQERAADILGWSKHFVQHAICYLAKPGRVLRRAKTGLFTKGNCIIQFRYSTNNLKVGNLLFVPDRKYDLDQVCRLISPNMPIFSTKISRKPIALKTMAPEVEDPKSVAVEVDALELKIALCNWPWLAYREPRPIYNIFLADELRLTEYTVATVRNRLADSKLGVFRRCRRGMFTRGGKIVRLKTQFRDLIIGKLHFRNGGVYNLDALTQSRTMPPVLTDVMARVGIAVLTFLCYKEFRPVPFQRISDFLGDVNLTYVRYYTRLLVKMGFLERGAKRNWFKISGDTVFIAHAMAGKGQEIFPGIAIVRGRRYSLFKLTGDFVETSTVQRLIGHWITSRPIHSRDPGLICSITGRYLKTVLAILQQMPDHNPHAIDYNKTASLAGITPIDVSNQLGMYLRYSKTALVRKIGVGIFVRNGKYFRLKKTRSKESLPFVLQCGEIYDIDEVLDAFLKGLPESPSSKQI